MELIKVLDKGYVRLVSVMGDDLSIANAARASFKKEALKMTEKDERLIKFLWDEKHTSPFRHQTLTFEVKAPLEVVRQWYKHTVASTYIDDQLGWNEMSARYVSGDFEFYIPEAHEWRSAPANAKQGSGEPVSTGLGNIFSTDLSHYIDQGLELYSRALQSGIAPEMARLFLPAYGMYTTFRWTTSLHALINYLDLRLDAHAQKEIQEYALACRDLTAPLFPQTFKAIYG
jgi:thymidylate synthase (FAD)